MGDYSATISMAGGNNAVDLADAVIVHHRSQTAKVHMALPSGGHVLHLAVAICIYNDVLAEARERGVTVTALSVSADGLFGGDPAISRGITYSLDIEADAPPEQTADLIAAVEADATIPQALIAGTAVARGAMSIRQSLAR